MSDKKYYLLQEVTEFENCTFEEAIEKTVEFEDSQLDEGSIFDEIYKMYTEGYWENSLRKLIKIGNSNPIDITRDALNTSNREYLNNNIDKAINAYINDTAETMYGAKWVEYVSNRIGEKMDDLNSFSDIWDTINALGYEIAELEDDLIPAWEDMATAELSLY